MFKKIDGWKTEIGLLVFVLLRVALKLDWIGQEFYDWAVLPVLGWCGISAKHAIKKAGLDGVGFIGSVLGRGHN